MAITRPEGLFDRVDEWRALGRFVGDPEARATLGVVSGRRRQGKSYLLDALCRQTGGFYFSATEATEAESLRQLGEAVSGHLDFPGRWLPRDWHEAVDFLVRIGEAGPVPVVLDEFPYLVRASPALPSILQGAYRPGAPGRERSSTRLLLCGSAMSFMGSLLSGASPLRGRAGLELVVRPFDFRTAAEFWGVTDPRLAVQVHAVVGGTPAYRREFARNDTPVDLSDFDGWVTRTVLSPESPLFREARYLLAEEPDLREPALYHSVLAAVAEGNRTRGKIASYLGRQATDLAHPLRVLEDAGLLRHEADAFRRNRSTYRITEPLVAFYHAVMRPVWAQLERPGSAARVWTHARRRFCDTVLGPHFEQLCREWCLDHADSAAVPDLPATVAPGTVADPTEKTTYEVDVVVLGTGDQGRAPVLALGEAKWSEPLDLPHLARLRHIRELVSARGRHDTTATRLLCFGGGGFTDRLRAAAADADDVTLVDLYDLYGWPRPASR